jgi:hypothetical protein
MAQYSKIAPAGHDDDRPGDRTWLDDYPNPYVYLDAEWAQYTWESASNVIGPPHPQEEAPATPAGQVAILQVLRGGSSAGRAPALQAGGRRFDPGPLHFLH